MIGYEELTGIEVAVDAGARERFFADNDVCVDDLLKMGHEMVMMRFKGIPEGAMLSARDIELAMLSMLLYGFEVAWRIRDAA